MYSLPLQWVPEMQLRNRNTNCKPQTERPYSYCPSHCTLNLLATYPWWLVGDQFTLCGQLSWLVWSIFNSPLKKQTTIILFDKLDALRRWHLTVQTENNKGQRGRKSSEVIIKELKLSYLLRSTKLTPFEEAGCFCLAKHNFLPIHSVFINVMCGYPTFDKLRFFELRSCPYSQVYRVKLQLILVKYPAASIDT